MHASGLWRVSDLNGPLLPEGTLIQSNTFLERGVIVYVNKDSVRPYGIVFSRDKPGNTHWHAENHVTSLGPCSIEELVTHPNILVRAIGHQLLNNKES